LSVCAVVDGNGFVRTTAETVCTEFQLLSLEEVNAFSDNSLAEVVNTLNSLFSFDLEMFGVIHGTIMVAFIVGHGAGRMVKSLNK